MPQHNGNNDSIDLGSQQQELRTEDAVRFENVNRDTEDAITLTRSGAEASRVIALSVVSARSRLLSELTAIDIAILGGVLTILTVGPELVKTATLISIGVIGIVLSMIVGFIARHILAQYLQNELFYQANEEVRIQRVALNLRRNPLDEVANSDFSRELDNNPPRPTFRDFIERAVVISGVLTLTGAAAVAAGLLLTVEV